MATTWFRRNGQISLLPPHFYFIKFLYNKFLPYLSLTGHTGRPQCGGSLAGTEYTFRRRHAMVVWLQHLTIVLPPILLHTMVQIPFDLPPSKKKKRTSNNNNKLPKSFPAYHVPSGQITILPRPTPTEWLLRWDASTISPLPHHLNQEPQPFSKTLKAQGMELGKGRDGWAADKRTIGITDLAGNQLFDR